MGIYQTGINSKERGMKREEIIITLHELHGKDASLSDGIRFTEIETYINQLEADKMEAYKAIVEDNLYIEDGDTWCNKCGGVNDKYVDSEVIHTGINCIVNKAVSYIKENS
jgi:hypothetical protein